MSRGEIDQYITGLVDYVVSPEIGDLRGHKAQIEREEILSEIKRWTRILNGKF